MFVRLHTCDIDVVYLDQKWWHKIPILTYLIENTGLRDEVMDIVIADYTSAAVDHVLNIVKYGSTALLSDDMKDVIEAGKLFFDVDLSSGNEQELKC